MKRLFDLVFACIFLLLLAIPMFIVAILIKLSSPGLTIYWSDRVGRENRIFRMPKFRTMKFDTPDLPTHLLKEPDQHLISVGPFLRKLSLDELPQLWSILRGDLSFVGPRPALYNQKDLIELRTEKGIHRLTPGLTGWAQVNGRDELSIAEKVAYDEYYLHHQSALFDLKIIFRTIAKVLRGEGVQY